MVASRKDFHEVFRVKKSEVIMNIVGKRAVVTGSTRGIGRAVATALVQAGLVVVVSSRNGDEAKATASQLSCLGSGPVLGQACDVRDPDQVRNLICSCVQSTGGLDILVNNAGIGIFKNVEDLTIQEWRDTISTNLDGVFYACHFAVPELRGSGGGHIINISSLAGKYAFAGGSAYNASKFGLIGFSEALLEEVRHDGISVVNIMPGSVNTGFRGRQIQEEDSWRMAAEDVAQVVLEALSRHPNALASRIEMRPLRPRKKS